MNSTTQLNLAPRSPMLKFSVGGLSCALPLGDVREITAMVWVTPVPGAGRHLLGVVNCHGTPCPVVDIRHLLNLPSVPIQPEQHLIVLKPGAELLAIACDRADTVVWGQVVPMAGGPLGGQVLKGLFQGKDGVTLILDSTQLMNGSPIGEHKLRQLARGRRVKEVRDAAR
jgi:chemotaxis signal transduction protein